MLAGRGVALGLGGMNLTDLSKGLNAGAASSAQYYRQQVRRCSSGPARRSSSSASVASPFRAPPNRPTPLARIVDVDSETEQKEPMEQPPKRLPRRKRQQTQPSQEETKQILVKRAFNRRTFWAACRAIIFGVILCIAGAAMCAIGYYNEHFAMETVILADNVTALAPNPSKKFQYQSLTYIGPVVMGAGAFVLMMACVTTLESRDRQARIYQEQQAQLDAERNPLSRRNTATKLPPAPAANPPSALKPSSAPISTATQPSSAEPERKAAPPATAKPEMTVKPVSYQQAELVAVPTVTGGGVVNRSFTRDDSKTASKPDTDSGPSGTTTTTLTWSKNGGPRCETDVVCKYPSTSCIDSLIRKPDERALLQRFLEDQSRLVEDRLNRRIQQQQQKEVASGVDDGFRSASLDAPTSAKMTNSYSRTFRSEEMAPRKNVVAAEVHHAGDASPGIHRLATPIDSFESPNRFERVPATPHFATAESDAGKLRAPVIAPDALELFSPMSMTPDTPASIMQQKRHSKSQILSPVTNPPPAPSRPHSPDLSNADRSISSSYVTVMDGEDDDFGASIDIFNANLASTTPVQRVYNIFAPPPPQPSNLIPPEPGNKKLYDSVFLAENLRLRAAANQQSNPALAEKFGSLDHFSSEDMSTEKMNSHEQTGVLCKDWTEMNANYLKNRQKL